MGSHTKYLDTKQVAELLNMTESWIRSQVFQKKIPFIKMGHLVRFDRDAIQRWVEERKNEEGV